MLFACFQPGERERKREGTILWTLRLHSLQCIQMRVFALVCRYDYSTFFPCSKDAAPEMIGTGAGEVSSMHAGIEKNVLTHKNDEHDQLHPNMRDVI